MSRGNRPGESAGGIGLTPCAQRVNMVDEDKETILMDLICAEDYLGGDLAASKTA